MAIKAIFQKGRPTYPSSKGTSILKYLPRPRVPYQPSTFRRENLELNDLKRLWQRGRIGSGRDLQAYYSTEKTMTRYGHTVNKIPKHELENFMPNIDLGPKALVTPTSLMSTRDGHRVTHDLIHSYDPHIGRRDGGTDAEVNHDNITPYDNDNVGLHGDTISSRARIYRWMRRGPQFNEFHYFNREVAPILTSTKTKQGGKAETRLYKKIIRLATKNKLKAACEEYRRCTYIPPVQVYRALLSACIAGGLIADAVAIYTDGDQLHAVTRDAECYNSLLLTAINANNIPRIMWIVNEMMGQFWHSDFMRTRIEPLFICQILNIALEYLLDAEQVAEATTVYKFLRDHNGLDVDLHIRMGAEIKKLFDDNKVVNIDSLNYNDLAIEKTVDIVLPEVAIGVYKSLVSSGIEIKVKPSVEWLLEYCMSINIRALLRLGRFIQSKLDLLTTDQPHYLARVVNWIVLLTKSVKPALTNTTNQVITANYDFPGFAIAKPMPLLN